MGVYSIRLQKKFSETRGASQDVSVFGHEAVNVMIPCTACREISCTSNVHRSGKWSRNIATWAPKDCRLAGKVLVLARKQQIP